MSERYFLALLAVVVSAAAVWLAVVDSSVVSVSVAVLLALLGVASIVNAGNFSKSRSLMPVFFIAALAYAFFMYLGKGFSYLVVSIGLLGLVGLVLSFGLVGKVKPAEAIAVKKAGASVEKKPVRKKRRSKSKRL